MICQNDHLVIGVSVAFAFEGDVEIPSFVQARVDGSRPRVEKLPAAYVSVPMQAHEEDVLLVAQDLLQAVAVVDVPIQDDDAAALDGGRCRRGIHQIA